MAKPMDLRAGLTPASKKAFQDRMAQLSKFIAPNQGLAKLLAMKGTQMLKETAKIVPVDQGALRQSAYISGNDKDIEIGYNAEYGVYVEFGTRGEQLLSADTKTVKKTKQGKGHGERPFFYPTINRELDTFSDEWSAEIVKLLKKK